MTAETVHVTVQGYGAIDVELPSGVSLEVGANLAGTIVAQIMQLVDPRTQSARFHPALGINGYGGKN